VVPLHVPLPSEHAVPAVMHSNVLSQQSLFGETPKHAAPVAQHGWFVCPQTWQVPA